MNEYIHSYLNCLQSLPIDLQSFVSFYLESDINYQYLLKDSMNLCLHLKSGEMSNIEELLDKISYKFIQMQEICDDRFSRIKEVEDNFESLIERISESRRRMSDHYTDCRPHRSETKKSKQEEERVIELETTLKRIITQILHPTKIDIGPSSVHTSVLTPLRKPDRELSEDEAIEEKPGRSTPTVQKNPYHKKYEKNRKVTGVEKQDPTDESSVNDDDRRTAKEDDEFLTNEDISDCESSTSRRRTSVRVSHQPPHLSNSLKRKAILKKKDKLPTKKFHRNPNYIRTKTGDGSTDSDEIGDSPDEKLYCLCKKVSYGDMIACDNDNCRFEWFHFACVDVKVQPKGKWFCPDCRSNGGLTPRRVNI